MYQTGDWVNAEEEEAGQIHLTFDEFRQFQPSLRDSILYWASIPNTEVLGYSQKSLRDSRFAELFNASALEEECTPPSLTTQELQDGSGAGLDVKFFVNVMEMGPDGVVGDVEGIADFLVVVTFGQ